MPAVLQNMEAYLQVAQQEGLALRWLLALLRIDAFYRDQSEILLSTHNRLPSLRTRRLERLRGTISLLRL
jgi:hypothetical protein